MNDGKITLNVLAIKKPTIWRPFLSTGLQIGVIGVGVVAESPAMQWAGFIALILIACGLIFRDQSRNHALTIDQARRRLDEIERENL